MTGRRIRVSSRALGPRYLVTVWVYDTVDELRRASHRWNGTWSPDAVGLTQVSVWDDGHGNPTDRAQTVIVRLTVGHLGTQVVAHELHHATAALYGSHIASQRISRPAHLNHYNEPFAHLFSDMMRKLVDRLWELGYYPSKG